MFLAVQWTGMQQRAGGNIIISLRLSRILWIQMFHWPNRTHPHVLAPGRPGQQTRWLLPSDFWSNVF